MTQKDKVFACLVAIGTDYDKLNRMVKITGITPADTFAYDGENRRIYSKESGVQLVNLYDIFGNLIAQYPSGSGLYTTDYIWANGGPRMRIDTSTGFGLAPLAPGDPTETPYWYHTDHLGTPHVLTDTTQAVQWQISLDPFGETVSENTPVISDNLRFPGQFADRGSLLNYNWNRYYQPKIGRYYEVDPAPSQTHINPYAYVNNNPILLTDRTGRQVAEAKTIVCLFRVRQIATRRSISTLDINEDSTFQDGKRDAFRHCYGLCLGVRNCGATPARVAGAIKEFFDPRFESGTKEEADRRKRMDTYNNRQGAECAGRKDCPPCYSCCLSKLNSGLLDVWKKQR